MAKDVEKKFRAIMQGSPEVLRVLNAKIAAEAGFYNRERRDYADHMNQKKKKDEAKRAVTEAEDKLKEISRKQKEHEKILAVFAEA